MHLPQLAGGFFLFATTAYAAIGPNANLYIGNKYIAPDGFNRSTVLAGSKPGSLEFPGPAILAHKGDSFHMNVIDQLTDTTMDTSTSIHWHGIFQKGSSWADGPVGVNQCPISPGHSFLYQFDVRDQAGTFWYHSHYSTQYCDGLRGPMVIYDPEDPYRSMYDHDDESTIITLADWFHVPANTEPVTKAVTAQSTLINGLGRYSGGPASPLAVISVSPNKRYRFRLISIACVPSYIFSIDGHNMTIIEVDSNSVEPLVVDSIQVFIGQRYSFILTANQPVSNYWVRANPNSGSTGFLNGINSAILRYTGAPTIDPATPEVASTNPMLETNLHPACNPAAPGIPQPGAADVNLNLDIQFSFTTFNFTMNNASFIPPTTPVLLQILSGAKTAQALLPPGDVYVLPLNKVIEISIPGGSIGSPHPFHLHGQAFSVIRSAGSSEYNFVNPVRRDVVNTGFTGDNTTIRFATDNAGPWILHCHIDFHLARGLAVVFAEDVPAIEHSNPPDAWRELCPIYDALPPSS